MACCGQYCRQLRHWMQLPPMTARPPSMRMLPRGQSVAHWPQPTHASLTANFCELVEGLFRRGLGRDRPSEDVLRDLFCLLVRAALRHGGRHRRQHHAVRQQPDARALVRHGRPVAQGDDAVELVQTGAHIARILADAERVRREADLNLAQGFLHAAGQTAAVAREDEADALGIAHIRDRGLPAHENDVRVAQLPGNGFRHVETVAGARVAEDHIFAHVKHSLKF